MLHSDGVDVSLLIVPLSWEVRLNAASWVLSSFDEKFLLDMVFPIFLS